MSNTVSEFTPWDAVFMRRAIALAKKGEGFCHPNPMVGAVIVKDGEIIGEGYHHRCGELHAERNAIASLIKPADGATLYVTLEPCCHYGRTPPCTEAILENRIARVVIGSRDPNPKVAGRGAKILRDHGVEVVEDFLREECDALNPVFFHYITTKMPYVRMKYAMTADGKIATKTGASKWITGEAARSVVQELRFMDMGIMAGIGTVLADDPMLNCRLPGGKDPVRILCDTHLRLPPDSQIAKSAGRIRTIDVCGRPDSGDLPFRLRAEALKKCGVEILMCPREAGDGVDLRKLMEILGGQEIDSILLEGGGTLNAGALEAGIVNEVDAFVAPKIFGGDAKTPVRGPGVGLPSEAVMLDLMSMEQIGPDVLLRYRVEKKDADGEGG